MILTEEERNAIEDGCEMMIGKTAFDAIEAAVLTKLAHGVSVDSLFDREQPPAPSDTAITYMTGYIIAAINTKEQS